jgi:hypothetical protein
MSCFGTSLLRFGPAPDSANRATPKAAIHDATAASILAAYQRNDLLVLWIGLVESISVLLWNKKEKTRRVIDSGRVGFDFLSSTDRGNAPDSRQQPEDPS